MYLGRLQELVKGGYLVPIVREAPRAKTSWRSGPAWELAVHESGHAICALGCGHRVRYVSIDPEKKSGRCKTAHGPFTGHASPDDPQIVALSAVDVGGAAAARMLARGRGELRGEEDFARFAARQDFDNFRRRAAIACADDEAAIERLRIAAIERADGILDRHWDAVEELSRDLFFGRFLNERSIREATRRAPSGGELVGEEVARGHDGEWIERRGREFFLTDSDGQEYGPLQSERAAMRQLAYVRVWRRGS